MASYRNSGYQYETSPRKIAPEYSPRKEQTVNKTKKVNTKNKGRAKTKPKLKPHAKTILYVFFGFALLFALSYQNSLINESFDQKEDLKKELATLEKENEQARVNIQNSLNLSNVEKSAKDMLGMKKLDASQKVYVSLPKKDVGLFFAGVVGVILQVLFAVERILRIFQDERIVLLLG